MRYAPEVRAAVIADLLSGLSVRKTAKKHGVALSTVQRWTHGQSVQVGTLKKEEMGELVIELVTENLRGLGAIARLPVDDPEWLKKQSAHDLALYAGVQTDKLIGVLNALRRRDAHD